MRSAVKSSSPANTRKENTMISRQQPDSPSVPIHVTRENVGHHRSEFKRLSRRYAQLAWATSANEQRERAQMQRPLMELYVALHPDTAYSQLDDLDMVIRGSRL
jgi:hypothetical protein